jgi:capsular exopolysaccharide synthesis family protein
MSVIEPRPGYQDGTSFHAPDLREYLGILRARRRMVVVVVFLVVASALAVSLTRTPIYQSEARVQTRPVSLTTADSGITTLNMETERALASSPRVAEIAVEEMGTDTSPEGLLQSLTVSVAPDTEILIFTFRSPEPRLAQRGAQAFADAYVRNRTQEATVDLESRIEPLEADLERLLGQLEDVSERLAATTGDAERAELSIEANGINNRIALVQQQLDQFRPAGLNVAQVLKPAVLSQEPVSPNHVRNVALAFAIGLALAIGIAFIAERLDDRLRSRHDLETYAGVPVLAVVPHVRSWRRGEDSSLVMIMDPDSAPAEAYRTLRTGVLFDAASHNGSEVVLVTSPEAGEGKTTTTANLGVALAQAGKRVLLLSADLRRPRLQSFFDLSGEMGLTNVLAGEERLSSAIVRPFGMNNLSMLPSGPVPGNPAELLGSQSMRSLMMEIRNEADVVLIDAPPVLAVADSLTLAQYADAVLLVADSEKTQRSAIHQARQHLHRVRARVMGAVLNNFDPSTARTYHSYAPYAYESFSEMIETSKQSRTS